MKEQEKKELFADFEAMLDSISEVETRSGTSQEVEKAFTFDKLQFAADLEKKGDLIESIQFCLDTIFRISGASAGAFYGLDPSRGSLHLLHSANLAANVTDSIGEYPSDSIIVRRVMVGKPTFRNFLGISILDEVNEPENVPSIIAVLPVHHNYKVIASIHILSSAQSEIPDYARYSLQTIAAQCGTSISRFMQGSIADILNEIHDRERRKTEDEMRARQARERTNAQVTRTKEARIPISEQGFEPHTESSVSPLDGIQQKIHLHSSNKSLNATELLINSIPAFTFVMTLDGRIVYINKYTLDRLGYPKKDIIGSYITSLYPAERQYANLDRKYAILEHQNGELGYILQAKGGTIYAVQFTVHKTRFNKKEAVICIGHEEKAHYRGEEKKLGDQIESLNKEVDEMKVEMETLRRQSEMEKRKEASFIEKISYEIRSMLNAAVGMTGLLMDTELDEEQSEYVETIRKSGDGMLEHINDIIESINFSPHGERDGESYYNRFSYAEQSDEVSVVDFSGKRLLLVDEDRGNRNAVARELEAVGWKVTSVATVMEAEELLAKHTQLDAVIIDMQLNRGDPHSLAKEIREKYPPESLFLLLMTKGTFDQSEANELESAVFMQKPYEIDRIRYRLAKFLSAQTAQRIAKIPDGMKRTEPLRILLVEDNHMDQKVAQWLLQNMGYQADIAENGLEALRAVQTNKYDIILMDIEMPEMDGVQTTRKIRDTLPNDQQPRIIAMTAHALKGAREQYLNAGMDDYIAKPVNEKKLIDALGRNLSALAEPLMQA